MFAEMFDALDTGGTPRETFYDGYVVNAIMDAAYASAASKRWEPVVLAEWRGREESDVRPEYPSFDAEYWLVKEEVTHYGARKLVLKHKVTGRIEERVQA
jgi:hypothetical protein